MNKTLKKIAYPVISEAIYFQFEEEFMDDNIRCIPMIVRFKLDTAGIKLKLAEWSKFDVESRNLLAVMDCAKAAEIKLYRNFLQKLVLQTTGNEATDLAIEKSPRWANLQQVDESLQLKAQEHGWNIPLLQWRSLSHLQRFALLKLYRPGHESKNFPHAMKEFNLI